MIKVLLFAQLREQIGENELQLESFKGTVKDLKDYVIENFPIQDLDQIMVAVNEEFCQEDTPLYKGDIVALIPPVSGG